MIAGPVAIQSLESTYTTLKTLILRAINHSLTHNEYDLLLWQLKAENLRIFSKKDGFRLLNWVIHSAEKGRPQLLNDVWHKHHLHLTIKDFRAIPSLASSKQSPQWQLFNLIDTYPELYETFFERFSITLTIDDLTDKLVHPDGKITSSFGLLAHSATKDPRLFKKLWPHFRASIKGAMLCANEVIGTTAITPLASLLRATKIGNLDPSIIQYCFTQQDDLRSGMPTEPHFVGDVVSFNVTSKDFQLFNFQHLLKYKDTFFDWLALLKDHPEHEAMVREVAASATAAGFFNAFYHLSLFYKRINQDEIAYRILGLLPPQSRFHSVGLTSSANWFLGRARVTRNNDKRLDYFTEAFTVALNMFPIEQRNAMLQNIAYSFLNDGQTMSSNGTGPICAEVLSRITAKMTAKSFIKKLNKAHNKALQAKEEAKHIEQNIDLQLEFPQFFLPSYTGGLKLQSVASTIENEIDTWFSLSPMG